MLYPIYLLYKILHSSFFTLHFPLYLLYKIPP